MLAEVALRRGARLQRDGTTYVPLDEASAGIVRGVAEELAAWLGYASVPEFQADTIGGRLRRLREVRE
jgi:hypothetical protein